MKKDVKNTVVPWESGKLREKISKHFLRVKDGNPLIGPHRPMRNSINLMSNDYLSLGDNTEIKSAIIDSINSLKSAPLMSAVYLNSESSQSKLEKDFAKLVGFEDSILCQSGYAANIGLLEVLLDSEKPVYVDRFAHNSFMQGCIAARITPIVFNHNDLIHLEELINQNGPGIILVDSIYSAIGSICDLQSLCKLKTNLGCALVVDESHSLGVFGKNGEGLVHLLKLTKDVDFITASLSKAFAGRAGLILGSKTHLETIRYNSSPAIFSSSLLPYEIAGLAKTLEVIKLQKSSRARLFRTASAIREGFRELGFNVSYSEKYIISVITGPEANVIILRDEFEKRGIYGAVFCAPATPKNATLIRFTINSSVTRSQIKRILKVAREVKIAYDKILQEKA